MGLIAGLSLARPSDAQDAPAVGVLNAHQFRYSEPEGRFAKLSLRARLDPLSFAEQIADEGFLVFHLPVVADPAGAAWANGALANNVALRQPGVKVINPDAPDADAVCFTLILCLIDVLDARAAQAPAAPVLIVLEARGGREGGRLARAGRSLGLAQDPLQPPTGADLARDIDYVLSARPAASLGVSILALGLAEPAPADAPFFSPEEGVIAVVPADGSHPRRVTDVQAEGRLALVVGSRWEREPSLDHIGARQAAALGAAYILLTPDTARTRP